MIISVLGRPEIVVKAGGPSAYLLSVTDHWTGALRCQLGAGAAD